MKLDREKSFLSIQKKDWYLIVIFFLMLSAILVKSFFRSDGYLTSDSTNYLVLAQNLLDGNGFHSYNSSQHRRMFFSVWPIGYPSLIYLIAKLTDLSVFWSSKILNTLLIGLILCVLRSLFNKKTYLYGLIFLFATFIEIFSFTWSENAFIFGLVWFSASILKFMNKPNKLFSDSVSIFFSALFLFLTRYIGAFSVIVIGFLGVYFGLVKKDKSKFRILLTISSINLLFVLGYLYYNFIETSYFTGTPRSLSSETNGVLILSLLLAVAGELIIYDTHIRKSVFFLLQYALIGPFILKNLVSFIKRRKNIVKRVIPNTSNTFSPSLIFGLIGSVYLFFIILMRWIFHFDELSFRLLAPGSFLLFISIINYIENHTTQKTFNVFKIFLLSVSLFSWTVHFPLKTLINKEQTYHETIKNIIKNYSDVEENSIILFEKKHINYLRPDLSFEAPLFLSGSSQKESLAKFMHRVNPKNSKTIYMDIPAELSFEKYDISFIQLTKKYKPNSLVKLK